MFEEVKANNPMNPMGSLDVNPVKFFEDHSLLLPGVVILSGRCGSGPNGCTCGSAGCSCWQ